jgi:hypothetical protein
VIGVPNGPIGLLAPIGGRSVDLSEELVQGFGDPPGHLVLLDDIAGPLFRVVVLGFGGHVEKK